MTTNLKQFPYRAGTVVGLCILAGLAANFNMLWLRLNTAVPGTSEQAAFSLLHIWWPVFSLSQPDGLVIQSFIGAPYLSNHLLYMPILQSIIFSILQVLVSPIAALNLVLIATQIGAHIALFIFFRRNAIPVLWAGLASTAFILSPWYHTRVAEADVIAMSVWIAPVTLFAWDYWRAQPGYWRGLLVAVALYGAVLCGVQNLMWLSLTWLPYAIWRRETLGVNTKRNSLLFITLGFMVLCLLYPLPDMVRSWQGTEPAYGPSLGEPIVRSVVGWLLRTSPALWLAVGLTVLFKSSANRQAVLWLLIATVSALIGFGVLPDPFQMVSGVLGLPYWPLAEREFFFGPALFAALIYMSLTWQASWASGERALYWWLMALGVGILVIITNTALLRPLALQTIVPPSFYREIAAEPEDYLLLEYPYGVYGVRTDQTLGQAAYLAENAVWDHKREMSGIVPYYDPLTLRQIQALPFLFPESLTDDNRAQAAEALGQLVREGRVGYVVVHPDLLSPTVQAVLTQLLNESRALCPGVPREGLIIYRALWHPYGCFAS